MAALKKKTQTRRTRPLYHSAKITDRRFRKVLWHFVEDHSAARTAQATGLSANSVTAIFRKLRVYFWEVGLFTDVYEGLDPREAVSDAPTFELALLDFHIGRYRDKRGLKSPVSEPDYHFAESHWRFQFKVMALHRPGIDVRPMMMEHLLEIIRLCGPVGRKPGNRMAGLQAVARQMDQRLRWMERNDPGFTEPEQRAELQAIRAIRPKT